MHAKLKEMAKVSWRAELILPLSIFSMFDFPYWFAIKSLDDCDFFVHIFQYLSLDIDLPQVKNIAKLILIFIVVVSSIFDFWYLIFGKISYRVEPTLMMWFLMFSIFDFWYLIFGKVSYRAELKPKAETAVELLHHSKDKTCRQVRTCFFLGQSFLKHIFLGHFFPKHCFSRAFFLKHYFSRAFSLKHCFCRAFFSQALFF